MPHKKNNRKKIQSQKRAAGLLPTPRPRRFVAHSQPAPTFSLGMAAAVAQMVGKSNRVAQE